MKALNFKLNVTLLIYILLVNLSNYCKVGGQIFDEECPSFACPKSICELKRKNAQNFCENVKCVGISVANCSAPPDSTGFVIYEERLTMCGCCPGCVRYSGIGEPCEVHPVDPTPDPNCSDQFCPILMNRCLNGLICPVVGPNERKCSYKPNSGLSEMSSCTDKRALAYSVQIFVTL